MKYLYPLLIFVPITVVAEFLHGNEVFIFISAALAIIPLAGILGGATESLAHHTGPRIGGLLNATLGNAAELIITIVALSEGQVDVVKASITGSIIGNLLLVLGASILFGGLKNGLQRFSMRTASINSSMMTLAVIGLAVPSFFEPFVAPHGDLSVEELSLAVAAALILGYALSLVFSFTAPEEAGGLDSCFGGDRARSPRRSSFPLAPSHGLGRGCAGDDELRRGRSAGRSSLFNDCPSLLRGHCSLP